MRDGLPILDADAHVVEPIEIFAGLLPEGVPVMDLPPTTPMVMCGDSAKLTLQLEARFSPASYLAAMDAQGIDAAVVYPSLGLFLPHLPELDRENAADICRAYNTWAASWSSQGDGRLGAVGILPQRHPALCVQIAREAMDLGLLGVLVRPNHIGDRALDDHDFDHLYAEVAGRGRVLAVHEGLGVRGPTIGSDRYSSFVARHACSHPLEQMAAAVAFLIGGVCERHPTLRVAFLESGTGWLPYWLSRLDEHREWMGATELAHLSLDPSEYFARQCVISTDPEDHLVATSLTQLPAANVVWASDFPHPDALYPDAVDAFLGRARKDGVTDEALRALLWDSPMAFYRPGFRAPA
jgi:predicted TIM-barrel fold metal-dependent hydrolase